MLSHAQPAYPCLALGLCALLGSTALGQNANRFYVAEYSTAPTLRIFDVDTGVVHHQVALQLSFPTDFATAPNGDLYASSSTSLFKIDTATGSATLVGNTGLNQVVGLEFNCSGGAVLVTASGQLATVNVSTGQAQVVASTGYGFSGDIATQGNSIYYASFNSGGGSRLARIDLGGSPPTSTDVGVISSTDRVLGLDFDGLGRLIASNDTNPGHFYSLSNLSGPISVLVLGSTTGTAMNGPIAGISSVIASGQQQSYCSPSLNSCGTSPTLVASGVPSASAPSGFALAAVNIAGQRPIGLFFTTAGRASVPFGSGTWCLQAPHSVIVLHANGTTGLCDGQVSIDFNAYARGLVGGYPNPPAFLSQPGTLVQCQFIGRDSPLPLLTQALEFSICE